MGELVRRVLEGYEPLAEWSVDDPDSVEAARAVLRRELDEGGYIAVPEQGGRDGDPVEDLPVDADRVVLTMPMGGG